MQKLTLPSNVLAAAIDFVHGAVEARHTLPILTNVLLTFRNNQLCMIGSNLELEMEFRIDAGQITTDAPFPKDWAITLPAKKLRDLVKSAPSNSDATIQIGGENNMHTLSFSGLRSRYSLQGLDARDFPNIEVPKERTMLTAELSPFLQAMQSVTYCMANQDVRYYLNGMQIEVSDGKMVLTATDGHRLAQNQIPVTLNGGNANISCIVPRSSVLELPSLMKGASGDVLFAVTSNFLMAKVEAGSHVRVVKTKLIDGRYPDWRRVIPRHTTMQVTLDRATVVSTISRVAILANEKYRGAVLSFEPDCLTISAKNPENEEAREELTCQSSGSLEIGANSGYLLDALKSFTSETLYLFTTGENGAMLLMPEPDSQQLSVLMPMRI